MEGTSPEQVGNICLNTCSDISFWRKTVLKAVIINVFDHTWKYQVVKSSRIVFVLKSQWLAGNRNHWKRNILQNRKLSENYDYWKKKKEKRCDYMKFSESTLVYFLGTILPQIGKCSAEWLMIAPCLSLSLSLSNNPYIFMDILSPSSSDPPPLTLSLTVHHGLPFCSHS